MQHEQSVQKSFGSQAEAYLASAVHAQGADLEAMRDFVARTEGARVLDLGCGAGHVAFAAAPLASEVVAYDLTETMLRVVREAAEQRGLGNIRTEQGAAERLPFEDASFDCVLSRYSAHHWRDLPAALDEVRRVLRPGGRVCLVDVVGAADPLLDTHLQAIELLRDPSHVRNYTPAEWVALLERAGLAARVTEQWRLPLEFSSWVKRIGTAEPRIAAIRMLWAGAPAEVRSYFAVGEDFSFELDVARIEAA